MEESKLTFIDAEYGANAALRRYQHPTLGILAVVTTFGRNGSADIVNLDGALRDAKAILWFAAWEREQAECTRQRAPRRKRERLSGKTRIK